MDLKQFARELTIDYPNAREVDRVNKFIRDNVDEIRLVYPDIDGYIEYIDGYSKSRAGQRARIDDIRRAFWKMYYDSITANNCERP